MKNIGLRIKVLLVTIGLCCFAIAHAYAQGPGFEEDVEDTPLDGGVTLIAAAAIGYGAKKMASRQKSGK